MRYLVLTLLLICASLAHADALADHSTLSLVAELSRRGVDVGGCWAETVRTASWEPPVLGAPVMYYELEVEGTGFVRYRWQQSPVFGNSIEFPIPAHVDTVRGRVRAVDILGRASEYSDWSLWHPIEQ